MPHSSGPGTRGLGREGVRVMVGAAGSSMTITSIIRPWASHFNLSTAWAVTEGDRKVQRTEVTCLMTQQVKPLGLSLRSVTSEPIGCSVGSDLLALYLCLPPLISLAPMKADLLCVWHPVGCTQCQCSISLVTAAGS